MTYQPITTTQQKEEFTKWLQSLIPILEKPGYNPEDIFETGDGTIETGKDLVGNFLATLTNQPVTIN